MTVTHRNKRQQPEEITTVNEPGFQIECDGCHTDLTHSIRIKCADPVCEPGDGVDICPACFCAGLEFAKHKRNHAYRVVELHSYPIFSEDWGADEELLLIEGISLQGLGNWQAIAEHVGTRTKEEVEDHYNTVYVESQSWPLPRMDVSFDIDPSEFQERKRRRISSMNANPPAGPKVAPTSAPGNHEIATFLPGRLEFEHEIDNEAEDLVKDLEFGLCNEWGGDSIMEDENDPDVKTRAKWEEEKFHTKDRENEGSGSRMGTPFGGGGKTNGLKHIGKGKGKGKGPMGKSMGGKKSVNGYHPHHGMKIGMNGVMKQDSSPQRHVKTEDSNGENGSKEKDKDEDETEENMPPIPFETSDSLAFKLTLLETYEQRVEKRAEAKAIMFERGLLEYKKMQAADKKRPKEDKDIIHRLRPFARLQTAADYEQFCADILYEAILRKRIAELQQYRRLGLTTAADITKWQEDTYKREQAKMNMSREHFSSVQLRAGGRGSLGPESRRASVLADSEGRKSHDRELTPKNSSAPAPGPTGRKPPAPLNLANSPYIHLLTPAEQTLCSSLRILPKPYLVIKETLIREYARRGGKLRRREARDLVKIDVNKTSRVWDFLVQAGYLRIGVDLASVNNAGQATTQASGTGSQQGQGSTQTEGQQEGQSTSMNGMMNGVGTGSSSSSLNATALGSTPSPRKTPSSSSLPPVPAPSGHGTSLGPPSTSQTFVNGNGYGYPPANGLPAAPNSASFSSFASLTFPNAPAYPSAGQ